MLEDKKQILKCLTLKFSFKLNVHFEILNKIEKLKV